MLPEPLPHPQRPHGTMDLTLTVTAFNYQTHISTVQLLPASGPYIIVTGMSVNDVEDNHVMYGETINLGFEFNNLGSENAEGINVAISSASPTSASSMLRKMC